jgi:choloylglycine hydrolase
VIVSGYEAGSTDDMNKKGFVANLLFLAESDYGKPPENAKVLSLSLWLQYFLDNYATVDEAIRAKRQSPLHLISSKPIPNGKESKVHLSISDATGDSAIFEYIDGKLVIHHGHDYKVMSNSPIYSKQLAINAYWEEVGGTVFLPGTSRSANRFARASFFLRRFPKNWC